MNDPNDLVRCLDSKSLPSSYPEKDALRSMPLEQKLRLLDADAQRILKRKAQQEALEELEAERIASGESDLDPDEPIETLARQRRWFDVQRERAAQWVDMHPGYFPNPRDRETQILIRFLDTAPVSFFSANMNFDNSDGQRSPVTMEELVKRCIDAEEASGAKDKLIDRLRDENSDLKHDLFLAKGNKK